MSKLNWAKRAYTVVLLCATTAIGLPAQTFTVLHIFDGTDGGNPFAGLVQATDGSLYGTTAYGGAYNNCNPYPGCGTVFKITPSGTLTTLYTFCSQSGCTDGGNPLAGLVQATDGNFYGTTAGGGANQTCTNNNFFGMSGCGTVFSLSVGLAPSPSVTLAPTSLAFGNQPVTITSGAMSITLTSSGGAHCPSAPLRPAAISLRLTIARALPARWRLAPTARSA